MMESLERLSDVMGIINRIISTHAPAYRDAFAEQIPKHHLRAVRALAACQTGRLGTTQARCSNCGHHHILFRSCHHRACPSCGATDTQRWIEAQQKTLLPVPYFHIVFTLPKELRRLVRSHQQALLSILFQAAFAALSTLAADPKHLGGQLGAIAVLHTGSRTLIYHPHLHLLVPGIALAPDGQTVIPVRRAGRRDFLLPVRPLAEVFRAIFRDRLRKALPQAAIPENLWQKPWVVYAKRTAKGSAHRVLRYLGRYIHRTAIANQRIQTWDQTTVTFRYQDSRDGRHKTMRDRLRPSPGSAGILPASLLDGACRRWPGERPGFGP